MASGVRINGSGTAWNNTEVQHDVAVLVDRTLDKDWQAADIITRAMKSRYDFSCRFVRKWNVGAGHGWHGTGMAYEYAARVNKKR